MPAGQVTQQARVSLIRSRPLVAAGLCAVAVAVPAWWVALYASESFRGVFVQPDDWAGLRSFLPADVGLTILTAVTGMRALRTDVSRTMAGLTAGAWGYATLWSVGAAIAGVLSALGAATMLVAFALVSTACHAPVSASGAGER